MLKSALLYAKVADGSRGSELDDAAALAILAKESKKRQESADLFEKGGNHDKAEAERAEKTLIDSYLPPQMDEGQVTAVVEEVMTGLDTPTPAQMGQIIGMVRAKAGPSADGGLIARLVKERLQS
jgi:uncharacterized protein YqeY